MSSKKYSVVVCVKNEEKRMKDCLERILANDPDEVIVVDGNSQDDTVKIAQKFPVKIIETKNSNLTKDRQIGIDAAVNDIAVMIDADHRVNQGDLDSLVNDLEVFNLDMVQSQLCSYEKVNYWTKAEEMAWDLNHNIPGPKSMIGTAPTAYKKMIFEHVKFSDEITSTIDDTDFIFRLSKYPHIKFGIGNTKISQLHFADFKTFLNKFKWYGKGDGEFCRKNPTRAFSMIFHLAVRYPIIYPIKSLVKGKWKVIPFFIMQGLVRLYGLIKYFLTFSK